MATNYLLTSQEKFYGIPANLPYQEVLSLLGFPEGVVDRVLHMIDGDGQLYSLSPGANQQFSAFSFPFEDRSQGFNAEHIREYLKARFDFARNVGWKDPAAIINAKLEAPFLEVARQVGLTPHKCLDEVLAKVQGR